MHVLFWVTLTHLIKTFTSAQFPNENLFHLKFVTTEEAILLDHAIREVKHVISADVKDDREVSYLRSLTCPTVGIECETRFDLLQSIFFSISLWCDGKLQDYHLYFSQVICFITYLSILYRL